MKDNELTDKMYDVIDYFTEEIVKCDPSGQDFKNLMTALSTFRELYDKIVHEERKEERELEESSERELANELKREELALKREELELKRELQKSELELRTQEIKNQKDSLRIRFFEIILSSCVSGVIDGVVRGITIKNYDKWMRIGYSFEENGSLTSRTFSDVRNVTKPKL